MFQEWAGGRVKHGPIAALAKEKLVSLTALATAQPQVFRSGPRSEERGAHNSAADILWPARLPSATLRREQAPSSTAH